MSGHSKWAGIKHQKAINDKRRGKIFTKLANAITVAAKQGGGNPDSNPTLRTAIESARVENMPSENIKRAIDRGLGVGGAAIEPVTYEAYGPGGIAILVEGVTDNKNRTAAEVRAVFNKLGGKPAESGAVSWSFEPRSVIAVAEPADRDEAMLKMIDAGAEDVEEGVDEFLIYVAPTALEPVKAKLTEHGFTVLRSELTKVPKSTVPINDEKLAAQIIRLMEEVEALDDVSASYSNFDIPEDVFKKVV